MRCLYKTLITFVLIVFLFSCKTAECYYGDPRTDFELDSIYQCKTDGLLFVEFVNLGEWFSFNKPTGALYVSDDPDSLRRVSLIYQSSLTYPLKQNAYWEVRKLQTNTLGITWTPLLNTD